MFNLSDNLGDSTFTLPRDTDAHAVSH